MSNLDSIKDELDRTAEKLGFPTMMVGVCSGSQADWFHGFGKTNADLLYSVASVTKPLTATAILDLCERGEMSLDMPIDHYLGRARVRARVGDAAKATVARVLDHTAGLPLHYQFYYSDEKFEKPSREVISQRYAHLMSAPGERYQYSNLGYGLLDLAIERVTGKSYADWMRISLFEALEMKGACIGDREVRSMDRTQRIGKDGVAYPEYDFDHPGGSAAWVSARALIRFARMHLLTLPDEVDPIISSRTIRQMQQGIARVSGDATYGLGWKVINDPDGRKIVEHTGSMGGVTALLRMFPDQGAAFCILINQSNRDPALFTQAIGQPAEIIQSTLLGRERRPVASPAAAPASEDLSPISGHWSGQVETHQGTRDLELEISGAESYAIWGSEKYPIQDLSLNGGWLTGSFSGRMCTEDADRKSHRLHLDFCLRDGVFNGALRAMWDAPQGEGGARDLRLGNALASWAELRR